MATAKKPAWLKGYLQASFRGVPFFIQAADERGGRNIITDRFPESETIEHTDLGPLDQEFTLSGYIIGDDYFTARDKLIRACRTPGSGLLVHPYRGVMYVFLASYDVKEVTEEGRVARFDLAFIRDKIIKLTTITPDTTAGVANAKKSFLEKISAWMDNAYSIVRKPVAAIEDVNSTLDSGLSVVAQARKIANTQAEFKRALDNMRGKLIELRLSGKAIADDFAAIINYGTDAARGTLFGLTVDNAREQLNESLAVSSFRHAFIQLKTPQSQQKKNEPAALVQKTIAYQGLAAAAGCMATVDFDSEDDAQNTEQLLLAVFDDFFSDPDIDDTIYTALEELRAAVHNDVTARSLQFGKVVDYELPQTTNILRLCRSLYGDFEKLEDIMRRNGIEHPGFLTQAQPIQVHTND